MAAGRIVVPPYFPARNRDFDLLSGAKLYVYDNETTTKSAIYTDEALTVLSANPVVANSSGQFPAVWADAGTEDDPVLYSVSVTTSTGASPGNPFNFDNYRPSVDWDTAAVALAEAAAEAAVAAADSASSDAALTAADMAAIEAIIAGSPDAPSVLNKLNRNGDNASSGLLEAIGEQYPLLTAASDVQDADILASYRSTGPLKKVTASRVLAYTSAPFALSSGSGLIGMILSGAGAVAQTLSSWLSRRSINPESFGAVGNGSTNDATALQAAASAALAAGVPLDLLPGKDYRCTSGLTFAAGLTVNFNGATISTASNITLLTLGSRVTLNQAKLRGPSSAYNANSTGIRATGTVNGAGVAPTFLSDICLNEPDIQNFGYIGFYPSYVERIRITNPIFANIGYIGFCPEGCRDVDGVGGIFDTFTGETGTGDLEAMAISWSCADNETDLVQYPPSKRCVWNGGLFQNIPTWAALDTHGGEDCHFNSPTIMNCRRAIFLVSRLNGGPKRCSATNVYAVNNFPAGATNTNGSSKRDVGAIISGDGASYLAEDCHVTGTFINFGSTLVAAPVAAASLARTDYSCGLDVHIVNPYGAGISVDTQARGHIKAVIENPQSDGVGVATTSPCYLKVEGTGTDTMDCTLDINMVRSDTTLNTYVGVRAIVSSGSLVNLRLNFQRFSFDTGINMVVGSNLGTVFGAYPVTYTTDVVGLNGVEDSFITVWRDGNTGYISIPLIAGTSDSGSFLIGSTTPLPVYMRPADTRRRIVYAMDNTTGTPTGLMEIASTGVINLYKDISGTSWTSSGAKRLYDCVQTIALT